MKVRSASELIIATEPPLCECARIAKRPLSWAPWVPGLSENSLLSVPDLEFSHEHIIWESSGDNIGFGPGTGREYFTGRLFREDLSSAEYRLGQQCFDGSRMREAVLSTPKPHFYSFLLNNCQDWVSRVVKQYQVITGTDRKDVVDALNKH